MPPPGINNGTRKPAVSVTHILNKTKRYDPRKAKQQSKYASAKQVRSFSRIQKHMNSAELDVTSLLPASASIPDPFSEALGEKMDAVLNEPKPSRKKRRRTRENENEDNNDDNDTDSKLQLKKFNKGKVSDTELSPGQHKSVNSALGPTEAVHNKRGSSRNENHQTKSGKVGNEKEVRRKSPQEIQA